MTERCWLRLGLLLLLALREWTTSTAFIGARPMMFEPRRRPPPPAWRATTTRLLDSLLAPSFVIRLQPSPLFGGPKWLQVHVKVVLHILPTTAASSSSIGDHDDETQHLWDFVPRNATRPETLAELLSLRAVPGQVRYQCRPRRPPGRVFGSAIDESNNNVVRRQEISDVPTTAVTDELVARANEFCATYSTDLHLLRNNCWTFAFSLCNHLNNKTRKGLTDGRSASQD
jgi:hypothetical protein